MSAATEVAKAVVPVAVKGFSVNSGIMTLVAIGVFSLLGVLVKQIVPMGAMFNVRRKDEMDALRGRVSELEAKIAQLIEHNNEADERAHRAEMRYEREMAKAETKISRSATAVQLLIGEVERLSSGNAANPVIKQARELIAMATVSEGNSMTPLYGRLANIPGTGE